MSTLADEIEQYHTRSGPRDWPGDDRECNACGFFWPCSARRAAAEIRALHAEIGEWREHGTTDLFVLEHHISSEGEWREPGARGREIEAARGEGAGS